MLMLLFSALIAMLPSSTSRVSDYATAYQKAQTEDKPLMVIVSAKWCPACQTLKNTTIKEMEASGELDEVSVAVVDHDADPKLAGELMRGGSIPQIIVFTKANSGGWKRSQLTGFQSRGPVRNLIRSAVSAVRRG